MKILAKMLGGSHSYGIQTPASDVDIRYIYSNDDLHTLIGLGKHEQQTKQNDKEDEVGTEFRNVLSLLRKGNTQILEMVYNRDWIELSPEWQLVIENRESLIDSETLFKCLMGYMQGELRLANGERTGKLGGKRKEAIDKYGFSPKNFVQLLRLAWAGSVFFKNGYFPVNVIKENASYAKWLLDIKINPAHFNKIDLNKAAANAEVTLVQSFENRTINRKFNHELADELCLRVYGPEIEKYLKKL